MLGAQLNTIHNLRHYQVVMAELREAIAGHRLEDHVKEFYERRGKTGIA